MACSRRFLVLIAGAVCVMPHAIAVRAGDAPRKMSKPAFSEKVAPFLAKYCTRCHGGEKPRAELALDVFSDEKSALKDHSVWERVGFALRNHALPPKKRP